MLNRPSHLGLLDNHAADPVDGDTEAPVDQGLKVVKNVDLDPAVFVVVSVAQDPVLSVDHDQGLILEVAPVRVASNVVVSIVAATAVGVVFMSDRTEIDLDTIIVVDS